MTGRKRVKHHHCVHCKHSDRLLSRINTHLEKCRKIHAASSNIPPLSDSGQSDSNDQSGHLQAILVCPGTDTFAVRKARQGPAAPVHVRVGKGGWECSYSVCQDAFNFHAGSLNTAFHCEHALACMHSPEQPGPDLVDGLDFSISSFGDADRESFISFCNKAKSQGVPVVKQFVPRMVDAKSSTRYIYYSIFADTKAVKYYSQMGRVFVTFDRSTKRHKCECGTKGCVHKKLAVLVSEINPIAIETRPEESIDPVEVAEADAMIEYVLEHKQIPFDMTDSPFCSSHAEPRNVLEIVPIETKCHKCNDVDLVISSSYNTGTMFGLFFKKTAIKVVTKKCPSCHFTFRYSEHTDGFFNFNNSSFFTIALLEVALKAWLTDTPITSIFTIMNVVSDVHFNLHLILDAVKAYCSLKNLDLPDNMSCLRCGHFPVSLTYDVIRSVSFDLDPKSVGDSSYSSFSGMMRDCCKHDLSRCYLKPKSVHYNSNVKHFSVKLSEALPPLISPNNCLGTVPSYNRPNASNDRPEEICLPLERIEQIAKSKNAYKELASLCKSLNIETRGGKKHMVAKLIDAENSVQVYTVIRKKFTKITGKSGGLLRGICPHGVTCALKVLVLPESVADYAHVLFGFKVQPSFNFSDIASVMAVHVNNQSPSFFRPFGGRIDDPEDTVALEMYRNGSKKALFDYRTYTLGHVDTSNIDHHSGHPVSGLSSVLSLYDNFHSNNHREYDAKLRSVESTNISGKINTSVAEQQNHVISLKKSYCNEMEVNQHIKFVVQLTCSHNQRVNSAWRARMEKSGGKCVVDDLGFLVVEGVRKMSVNPISVRSGLVVSPHPVPVLGDSSGECSAFNAVIYSLSYSHALDGVVENSKDSLILPVVSFIRTEQPYDAAVHVRVKDEVVKRVVDAGKTPTPVYLLLAGCLPELLRCDVLVSPHVASSVSIGVSLVRIVSNLPCPVDYLMLIKPKGMDYFVEPKMHFDLKLKGGKMTRYKVSAFVGLTGDSKFSCFFSFGGSLYEIGSTVSVLAEPAFLQFSRNAEYIILKLTPGLCDDVGMKDDPRKAPSLKSDPFQFEPAGRVDSDPPPSKKRKVKVTSSQTFQAPGRPWIESSDTGRLDMFTEQYEICQSKSAEYDDVIVNSYAKMCQIYRRNSFIHQDTCRGSVYFSRGFSQVDQKFVQVINRSNSHWYVISNALTFVKEPTVVEVFDSLVDAKSLRSVGQLDLLLARWVLQIKPHTDCIRYVETQVQAPGSRDCGPWALGFVWALSMGHQPKAYDHLRASMLRQKIRASFVENRFVPPVKSTPRVCPKVILKSFRLNRGNATFQAEPS